MAKKCSKCECPAGEKWAVPFADFLSLLLALFIALYALASVNIEKQIALKEEFMKIYDFNTDSQTLEEPQEDEEVAKTQEETDAEVQAMEAKAAEIIKELDDIIETQQQEGGNLDALDKGTIAAIPANLLFQKGQATLSGKYVNTFLEKISKIILALPEDTEINIKGFSDSKELTPSAKIQDALELSTARANNVIRELVKYRITKERFYSSGYGDGRNTNNADGTSNRRVEFEVKTMQYVNPTDGEFIETIFGNLPTKK